MQWKLRHTFEGDACKVAEVAVAVGVPTMRPRWRGESDGSPALRELWNKLIQAVDRNQAYHREQAVEAGREIEAALTNARPAATCEALTEAANQAANAILDRHKKASEEHDRRTDYGRTYGASLI